MEQRFHRLYCAGLTFRRGWLPTVDAVWACKAAPGKSAEKHPSKSMETKRGALAGGKNTE